MSDIDKKHPLIEPAVGNVAIVKAMLAENYFHAAEERLTSGIIERVAAFEHDIVSSLNEVDLL